MKRIFRIGIVLIAMFLTLYNFSQANEPIGGGGGNCEKHQGENMYGTHCWITSVNGPNVHQYVFDTFWCTANCSLGGTNCCYALEVRAPE
jgi:hypothetical protein